MLLTKNKDIKLKIIPMVAIILIFSLTIAGAISFYSFTVNKKNVFTLGETNITLIEDGWYDNYGNVVDDVNSNMINDKAENLMPSETIEKSAKIKNSGTNNAYVFICVGTPICEKEQLYTKSSKNIYNKKQSILVKAYGIQENLIGKGASVTTVWNTFSEEIFKVGGTLKDKDKEYIGFATVNYTDNGNESENIEENIYEYNSSNWTKIETIDIYKDFSYSIYGYNNLLEVGETTEPLFNQLNISLDIGFEKSIA